MNKLNKDLINIIYSYNFPCLEIIKKRKLLNENELKHESRSLYIRLENNYCYDKNLKSHDNLENAKIIKFKHITINGHYLDTYWTIMKINL